MTPTMRLRFVERVVPVPEWATFKHVNDTLCTVKVLQQWWRQDRPHGQMLGQEGQWRDVPLEKEE